MDEIRRLVNLYKISYFRADVHSAYLIFKRIAYAPADAKRETPLSVASLLYS